MLIVSAVEKLRNRVSSMTAGHMESSAGGGGVAAAVSDRPVDTSWGATAVIVNRYKMERRQSQSQASRMVSKSLPLLRTHT